MTNIPDLRASVEGLAAREARDLLSEVSSNGLLMAFNSRVPDPMRIATTAGTALHVSLNDNNTTGKDLSKATDHFARAVAALGRELKDPRAPFAQLRSADYVRAPLYVAAATGSVLTLSPQRGPLVMGSAPTESLSQNAFQRLANLLPSGPGDTESIDAIMGARTPSMLAVREVALAAKRAGGLSVRLTGTGDSVTSIISAEQANELDELLAAPQEDVTSMTVRGAFDGVRCHRRIFYLEREQGSELSGVMDEDLVDSVQGLLGQRVSARLEVVTTRNLAGRQQRPHYRLVGVYPIERPPELDLPTNAS